MSYSSVLSKSPCGNAAAPAQPPLYPTGDFQLLQVSLWPWIRLNSHYGSLIVPAQFWNTNVWDAKKKKNMLMLWWLGNCYIRNDVTIKFTVLLITCGHQLRQCTGLLRISLEHLSTSTLALDTGRIKLRMISATALWEATMIVVGWMIFLLALHLIEKVSKPGLKVSWHSIIGWKYNGQSQCRY